MPVNDEVVFESVPVPAGILLDDLIGTVEKHLAGKHDQSTHGRGSNASVRRMNAGNGLTARQIYNNQVNQGDSQQKKLYAAEGKFAPEIARIIPEPSQPMRADFPDFENYRDAYNKYDKEWDDWARETSRSIMSDVGQKHLDGTNKGVQKYFDEVTQSEWFVDKFGDANPFGKPKFSLVSTNAYAGQFSYYLKNNVPSSTFKVNKSMAQHEMTILHEIAHYATAISESNPFESHGKEFASNVVYLTKMVIGEQASSRLENEYVQGGVTIG
jgi:putative metallohydrolase (TIGR04338 family)